MTEIYSIGVSDEPRKGVRTIAVGLAVPLSAVANPALWAAEMEALRVEVAKHGRVVAARAEPVVRR